MFEKFIKIANKMDKQGLISEANMMDDLLESYMHKIALDQRYYTYNGTVFSLESSISSKIHQGDFGPDKFELIGFKNNKVYYHVDGLSYENEDYDNMIISFDYKAFADRGEIKDFESEFYDTRFRDSVDPTISIEDSSGQDAKSIEESYGQIGIITDRDSSVSLKDNERYACFKENLRKLDKFITEKDPTIGTQSATFDFFEYITGLDASSKDPKITPDDFLEEYKSDSFRTYINNMYLSEDADSVNIKFKTPGLNSSYPSSKCYVLVFADHALCYVKKAPNVKTHRDIETRINVITNFDLNSGDMQTLKDIMDSLNECNYFQEKREVKVILDASELAKKQKEEEERKRLEQEEKRKRLKELKARCAADPSGEGCDKLKNEKSDDPERPEGSDVPDSDPAAPLVGERVYYTSDNTTEIILPVSQNRGKVSDDGSLAEGLLVQVKKKYVLIKLYNGAEGSTNPEKYLYDITSAYFLKKFHSQFKFKSSFDRVMGVYFRGDDYSLFDDDQIGDKFSNEKIFEFSPPTFESPEGVELVEPLATHQFSNETGSTGKESADLFAKEPEALDELNIPIVDPESKKDPNKVNVGKIGN